VPLDDVTPFLRAFLERHGRAPRVLHIGNIANNAYLDAKLLNEAGYDCDVICADYYHIMGCPEWEDADFDGDVGDQFRPKWYTLDLHGFKRPRWFAQGVRSTCLDYLIAKRSERHREAERLWRELCAQNYIAAPATVPGSERLGNTRRTLRWEVSRLSDPRAAFRSIRSRLTAWAGGGAARRAVAAFALVVAAIVVPVGAVAVALRTALRYARRWMALSRHFDWATAWSEMAPFARRHGAAGRLFVAACALLVFPASWARAAKSTPFADRVFSLISEFQRQFPARADHLSEADLASFALLDDRWAALFTHYDVIQAYSTDGILPLLTGSAYICFEHGTLREIPLRETAEGRWTALAYRMATHVFVTNFDCLGNAEWLAPERHTLINHPFDEDHALDVSGFEPLRRALGAELEADVLFFFPTRHDWVRGTGYADKGNDVFLRAFCTLRDAGFRVGAVCCEWGANVAQSRAFVEEAGCATHVKWIAPLPTVSFERMAHAAHCVVDQFMLGSFGGVMFKAMATGAPVLTYLEEAQLLKQYPECPPVINCRTAQQIVDAMTPLLRDPGVLADIGRKGRAWMKQYHSKRATISRQTSAYASLLGDAHQPIA